MIAASQLDRARAYIEKIPGAISGAGGHNQTFAVACKLAEFGLSPADAWLLLLVYNQRCQPPWNDRDLKHKLDDAFRHANRRTDFSRAAQYRPGPNFRPKIDPANTVEKFLEGFRCTPCDLIAASTCKIPPRICGAHFHRQGAYLVDQLFEPGELVNIVDDFLTDEGGKAKPKGFGVTLPRNKIEEFLLASVEWQAGGAWIRMNPMDGKGVADANVGSFRFGLIELDDIPMELQTSLLAKLRLPIAAIITSGGRSLHAWVRLDARTLPEYRQTMSEMLALLARFGVDGHNKNPARMSRLPGVTRQIGAQGDGRQQLIYLNPNPEQKPIL